MLRKLSALAAASLVFTFAAAASASATPITYNVNGTIGSDTLTGTLTFDPGIPANGLQAVYSALNLTLSGPQTGANGLIAASFSDVEYWSPASLPPTYGVLSDSILNLVNGYSNLLALYIPADPSTILGSPFRAIANQELNVNGVPVNDNVIEGTATLTAVPEAPTWAMMVFGLFAVGVALRFARRKYAAAAA